MQAMASETRLLVTGGSGFVGETIVLWLRAKHPEWPITILDIKPRDEDVPKDSGVSFTQVDVRNADDVTAAMMRARPTLVVHTSGVVPKGMRRYDGKDREYVFQVNVEGTRNVVNAAKAAGAEALVFTGSCTSVTDNLETEYPNFDETVPFPKRTLVYGESKAKAEEIVLAANSEKFKTCSLRPSTILGRKDYNLVPHIHACIDNRETPFVIGDGDNLYDFTFVDNVAQAHVLAVENLLTSQTAAGQAILISNGQPVTFRDFCLAVWAAFDHCPQYSIHIPASLAGFAGYIAEWLSWFSRKPTTLCRGSVKDAVGTRYANISKARGILGFEPVVDLWDGIRITAEAYKARLQNGAACL